MLGFGGDKPGSWCIYGGRWKAPSGTGPKRRKMVGSHSQDSGTVHVFALPKQSFMSFILFIPFFLLRLASLLQFCKSSRKLSERFRI